MGPIVPDTLNGALVLSLFAFVLTFVVTSLIGLILAAFPFLNRLGPALAWKIVRRQPAAEHAREQADCEQADTAEDYHIAAISAAIATIIGPHRIVHIEPVNHGMRWQADGRAAHHGSHTVSHPAPQRQTDN